MNNPEQGYCSLGAYEDGKEFIVSPIDFVRMLSTHLPLRPELVNPGKPVCNPVALSK
jgi:hypothetical protein